MIWLVLVPVSLWIALSLGVGFAMWAKPLPATARAQRLIWRPI